MFSPESVYNDTEAQMVQAGAGWRKHPAPCLRSVGSIHNGACRTYGPYYTVFPLEGGNGFLCVVLFGGAVYGFFSVHCVIFAALRKERGGGSAPSHKALFSPLSPKRGKNKGKEPAA